MRHVISLTLAAGLAVLVSACATDGYYGSGPYYGPSQGYGYPPSYGYYGPRPGYYPARYGGYGYGSGGPSITFNLPMGTVQ